MDEAQGFLERIPEVEPGELEEMRYQELKQIAQKHVESLETEKFWAQRSVQIVLVSLICAVAAFLGGMFLNSFIGYGSPCCRCCGPCIWSELRCQGHVQRTVPSELVEPDSSTA